ncbi:LppM family (lipo)protein [Rhodococcus sp. NPDC057135]|uniref:LppM family (lipo)protein n=1 Tax=Rhodococcus sp. NPDC057135 TaxID=3346028 RepID=UPI00363540A6
MASVQQSTDPAAKPTSRKRFLTVAALALMLVPLLAGCIRVQVSMGVSANDRVSGQVVAAAIPADEADKGPQLTPPSSLEDKVRVQEYKKDGYVGSQAFFSDLSFGDVAQLSSMYAEGSGSFQLTLKRSGDTVTLDGKVDLKTLPAQGADVQVSIAFPARVGTTNGTRDGDSRVSWTLPAGEVSTMRAEVNYADPSTRSFAGWAGIMAGLTLGVAIVVGALAWMARNRAPVKRAPASKAPAMKAPVAKPPVTKQADTENPRNTTK